MILYHGTSTEYLDYILSNGLLPRVITKMDSNWRDEIESRPKFVYLTSAYPVYYAPAAVKEGFDLLIIKVDVDETKLFPDEDFIAFCLRGQNENLQNLALKYIVSQINPADYKRHWEDSLKYNGNACIERVDKAKIIDHRVIKVGDVSTILKMGGDAIPSPLNYKFHGNFYEQCVKYIFNEINEEPIFG